MRSCDIHMRAVSQEMFKISICDMSLKITNLRIQPNFPGTNVLPEPMLIDHQRHSGAFTRKQFHGEDLMDLILINSEITLLRFLLQHLPGGNEINQPLSPNSHTLFYSCDLIVSILYFSGEFPWQLFSKRGDKYHHCIVGRLWTCMMT